MPCLSFKKERQNSASGPKPGEIAILDILSAGDFVGKDSIAGQSSRTASASAMTDCSLLRIEKKAMMFALTGQVELANIFWAYVPMSWPGTSDISRIQSTNAVIAARKGWPIFCCESLLARAGVRDRSEGHAKENLVALWESHEQWSTA